MRGRCQVHPFAWAMLLILLVGCAAPATSPPLFNDVPITATPSGLGGSTAPSSLTAVTQSPAPSGSDSGIAGPTPLPTPFPTHRGIPTGPVGDLVHGPSGDWPGRPLFTFPQDGSASRIVGIDDAGTVYTDSQVTPAKFDSSGVDRGHVTLRAFRADGSASPGWPAGGVILPGELHDAALGPDGTMYLAMEPPALPGTPELSDPWPLIVTALDAHGNVLPGWTYKSPAGYFVTEARPYLVLRPGGGVCFPDRRPGAPISESWATEIVCLGADGRMIPGWPVHTDIPIGPPAFGPDGTMYVARRGFDAAGTATTELIALDLDGGPHAGWTSTTMTRANYSRIDVASGGSVMLSTKLAPFDMPSFVAFDSHGKRRPAWESNVRASLASTKGTPVILGLDVATDGTIYLAVRSGPNAPGDTALVQILAIGPDGATVRGWPLEIEAIWAWADPVHGSVWVWWPTGGAIPTGARLAVLGPDGTPHAGWPVAAPGFLGVFVDATGVAFLITREGSYDVLEAIDPHGRD